MEQISLDRLDTMLPSNLNQVGYTSCMKIFGVPILPPLITEERRKELNGDKQRAIEIEKKLKGKRSSIDSGVMTGSYIEHFRNIESQQTNESCLNQPSNHDLSFKGGVENCIPTSSSDAVNYVVSDSFLKTALEDPEFREFFSTTADKIFKDNKVENILNFTGVDDSNSFEVKNVSSKESEIQSLEDLSVSSSFVKPSESLDLCFSDSLSRVPSVVESDITLKCSESTRIIENGSDGKQTERDPTSPPPHRIRRNSYTLENPSPVLLEHIAKEIASVKKEVDKWQILSDSKDKTKGPGFKTFSGKSQRKHWNKKNCNQSSNFRVANLHTKYTLRRSNTFIKPEPRVGESNYSLPCSSRTSPLQLCPFTRSADCIKSMGANPLYELNKEQKCDFSVGPGSVNKMNVSRIPFKHTVSSAASDSETFIVQKDREVESASAGTSPPSLVSNPSCSVQSTCSTENYSPPQIEFSDSVSQISVATQSTYLQQNSVSATSINDENVLNNINHSEDFDDIVSLCSSMSISRFFPPNDVSRPSTAGDVSEANIRILKMKHENELRELLAKQRKEEEMYSQILSSSGSLTSRTTTNLSIGDPFESHSEVPFIDKRDSCSRELFPSQKTSPVCHTSQQDDYSEREKEAATKLTACAKGYLTRRLLKTEKVQQLIELIKESLTCAFSLQLEPHLKPNDLELHARLAHQLTAALSELQTIVSAPVAARMAVIAADRERLRKPASRPSSAISLATRKSILRRQQSLNSAEKKHHESRARTKSFSVNGRAGSVSSGSRVRSDSASTVSTSSSCLPWR